MTETTTPKTPLERAAALLREEREKRGMTQARLAVDVGVSPATVSNLERGCPVTRSTVDRLAAYLGLTETIAVIYGEVAHG